MQDPIGGIVWQRETFPPRPAVLDYTTQTVLDYIETHPGSTHAEIAYKGLGYGLLDGAWGEARARTCASTLVYYGRVEHTQDDRYRYFKRGEATYQTHLGRDRFRHDEAEQGVCTCDDSPEPCFVHCADL